MVKKNVIRYGRNTGTPSTAKARAAGRVPGVVSLVMAATLRGGCRLARASCGRFVLASGGVPRSGQLWEPGLSKRSPLLRELLGLARALLEGDGWPTLEAYSAFVEEQRAARAAELPGV